MSRSWSNHNRAAACIVSLSGTKLARQMGSFAGAVGGMLFRIWHPQLKRHIPDAIARIVLHFMLILWSVCREVCSAVLWNGTIVSGGENIVNKQTHPHSSPSCKPERAARSLEVAVVQRRNRMNVPSLWVWLRPVESAGSFSFSVSGPQRNRAVPQVFFFLYLCSLQLEMN